MEKPCHPKEVIFMQFNYDNLSNFLDYLENRQKDQDFSLTAVKIKMQNFEQLMENLEKQLPEMSSLYKEIDKKFQKVNERVEKVEGLINRLEIAEKNLIRLNDFEVKSKEKLDVK